MFLIHGSAQPGGPAGQPPVPGTTKPPAATQDRKLYVGNLDSRVDQQLLFHIFSLGSTTDIIQSVKIINQQDKQMGGLNYGFVEFHDRAHAEQALMSLNGKKILSAEIKVNWAHAAGAKEDTSSHFHIFVGDLSPEINDQALAKAFSHFTSMSEARVMWDSVSRKSRGYGFVSFREKPDADQAIVTMNGQWLGARQIRVNWANHKTQSNSAPATQAGNPMGGGGVGGGKPDMQNYQSVVAQTPPYVTTVYIGNMTPNTTQQDLMQLFSQFGVIVEVKIQAEKGYGFVKFQSHENAAVAICSLNGTVVHGRSLKCSWGRDRAPDGYAMPPQPLGFQPQQQWAYSGVGPNYSARPPQMGAENYGSAPAQYWNAPPPQGYF
ncbi:putative polyadenylated RNA protein [Zopfochytrium polystomum]|nr:putative polyadenylated RNA protein [Zopfochytrium polystomum]